MNTIDVKEYDSLRISCEYQDNDGQPLSLDGIAIESTMQSLNNQYKHTLGIEMSDMALGQFVLTSDAERILPTLYKVDVSFLESSSGARITSETFNVNVKNAVTVPSGVSA
ncbi:hypothetical protein ACI2I3_10185 [Psychrobacter namhaensis]|uniref:Uncharacterized protein n=1 Tax=Psychrobacter namhaensis TaxID=292734 RepID=A0ABW8LAE4_9GAMM